MMLADGVTVAKSSLKSSWRFVFFSDSWLSSVLLQ